MNILISSVGRQVFLINAFKEALNKKGKVIAIDYDKTALALTSADEHYIAPPYNSVEYIPWLTNLCTKQKINLLLTLNVDDLLVLEPQRDLFSKIGCFLIGGDIGIIQMTYDKYALSNFCNKLGLNTPKIYLKDELYSIQQNDFPLIAKPRYGKGSRGHTILKTDEELYSFLNNSDIKKNSLIPYIFQKLIQGEEYGLDCINNFNAEFAGLFVRKKNAMKNGETFEAITQSPEEWNGIGKILSKQLNHHGTVDIDLMVENGKKYIIDINHRFGGGYIFSHIAGANLPKVFVSWISKDNIQDSWLNPISGIHSRRDNLGIKLLNADD